MCDFTSPWCDILTKRQVMRDKPGVIQVTRLPLVRCLASSAHFIQCAASVVERHFSSGI